MAGVNELNQRFGALLFSDEQVDPDKWSSASIIFSVDPSGSEELRGYLFADDAWQPFLPEENLSDMVLTLRQLREALKGDAKDGWASGMFQVDLQTSKVTLKIEYDDPERWSVNPDNMQMMIEEIRP